MDLSWCIMCDKRTTESSSMADSLYCSEECRLLDHNNLDKPTIALESASKPASRKSTTKHTSSPSANYPWIPCYNKRRHNYLIAQQVRRCSSPAAQPIAVAGSAAALGNGILSLIH